jgi:hypothetical protein
MRDCGLIVESLCPWIGLEISDVAWLLDGHAATILRTQKAYLNEELGLSCVFTVTYSQTRNPWFAKG